MIDTIKPIGPVRTALDYYGSRYVIGQFEDRYPILSAGLNPNYNNPAYVVGSWFMPLVNPQRTALESMYPTVPGTSR